MRKEEIEQVLIKYIEHVLEIEGTDFIVNIIYRTSGIQPNLLKKKKVIY